MPYGALGLLCLCHVLFPRIQTITAPYWSCFLLWGWFLPYSIAIYYSILLPDTSNRKWSISSFMTYFSEFVSNIVPLTSLTAYVLMGFCLQVQFCHYLQVIWLSLKLMNWYLFLHQPFIYHDYNQPCPRIKAVQFRVSSSLSTRPRTTLTQRRVPRDYSCFVGNLRPTKECNALKVCPLSSNVLYPALSDPNIRNGMTLIRAIKSSHGWN